MSRFHLFAAFAALLALPVAAQTTTTTCNLHVSITCNATTSVCTATTLNAGSNTCSGQFITGIWALGAGMTVTGETNSLGLTECFDTSNLPNNAGSGAYGFCFGQASLAPNASFTISAKVTGTGPIYGVTAVEGDNGTEGYAYAILNATGPTCTPVISAPPVSPSGLDYQVTWTTVSDPTAQYLVDESTAPDFSANVVETQVNGLSKTFHHDVTSATTYYYRVKATNCAAGTPDFSGVARTIVQPPPSPTSKNPEVSVPAGTTQPVSISVAIPGNGNTVTFSAETDKPYLTVSPSSGTIPPNGTNVTVTAAPGSLPSGTNTGTLKVTSNGTTTNTPISVSIVTPVQPSPKDTPPPNALVFPIVTHVNSGAGPFLSDIRLANGSSQPTNYLVTMAPIVNNVPQTSQSTTITVPPQGTAALNDVVKNFFGFGATGAATDTAFGSLQIRPLDSASPLNFASSRTYTTQAIGTFGQYIAAIPFGKFATLAAPPIAIPNAPATHTISKLSLQQIAVSDRYRTNVGFAEGAGQPAHIVVRVYDDNGVQVASKEYDLAPGQVQQPSLATIVPSQLQDGRIEVEITSQTGAVTAYASVIDNGTTDPFEVAPVDVSTVSATQYILPGIAELNNGANNYHSDARIFNGGSSDVTATLTFNPFPGSPGATPKTLTIPAGHIAALDNILPQFFGVSGTGGSVVITTPSASSLVATANTYTITPKGTYGQFIPGLTSADGVGPGARPLQILQLEESDKFHSNVAVTEVSGNPVTVTISLYEPDSKVTPSVDVQLGPNGFTQFNSIIKTLFGESAQAYNSRVSIQVTGGNGRVAAYGSVIDNQSKDATYVPQQ